MSSQLQQLQIPLNVSATNLNVTTSAPRSTLSVPSSAILNRVISDSPLKPRKISNIHKKIIKKKFQSSLIISYLGCFDIGRCHTCAQASTILYILFLVLSTVFSLIIAGYDQTHCLFLDIVMILIQIESLILYLIILWSVDKSFKNAIINSLVTALFETDEYLTAVNLYSQQKRRQSLTISHVEAVTKGTSVAVEYDTTETHERDALYIYDHLKKLHPDTQKSYKIELQRLAMPQPVQSVQIHQPVQSLQTKSDSDDETQSDDEKNFSLNFDSSDDDDSDDDTNKSNERMCNLKLYGRRCCWRSKWSLVFFFETLNWEIIKTTSIMLPSYISGYLAFLVMIKKLGYEQTLYWNLHLILIITAIIRYIPLIMQIAIIRSYYDIFDIKVQKLSKYILSTTHGDKMSITHAELVSKCEKVMKPYRNFTRKLSLFITAFLFLNGIIWVSYLLSVLSAIFGEQCYGAPWPHYLHLVIQICSFWILWVFVVWPLGRNHGILEEFVNEIQCHPNKKIREKPCIDSYLNSLTNLSPFSMYGVKPKYSKIANVFYVVFITVSLFLMSNIYSVESDSFTVYLRDISPTSSPVNAL